MKRKRIDLGRVPWTPFVRAQLELTTEGQRRLAKAIDAEGDAIFLNSRYQVNVRRILHPVYGEVAHASIKAVDKSARHDWRDFQRIKNELFGPEHEAIEIYPAESRLVDTANQYHLYVFRDYKIDLGFQQRLICGENGADGSVQRPFEPGQRPPDAASARDLQVMIADLAAKSSGAEG